MEGGAGQQDAPAHANIHQGDRQDDGFVPHPPEAPPDESKPKRRLRGCFFLLGMGNITWSAAVLQAGDYLNAQYTGVLSAVKVIQNFYTFSFLAVAAILFLGKPQLLQDNLRPRMLYGYIIYVCVLVVPAVLEGIIHSTATSSGQQYAVVVWAFAAALAGGTEAVVSQVLNGQAAVCKCNFYATYGRTLCFWLMLSLRCITKATIPVAEGDLDRLRLSASVHFAVGAALLLACVLIIAYAIPALAQQVADTVNPDVPTGLTFQQTLAAAYTAIEGGPKGDQAAASLAAAGTLAPMMPGVEGVYGIPVFEVTRSQGSKRMSVHFSVGQPSGPARALFPGMSGQQSIFTKASTKDAAMDSAPTYKQQSMARRYIQEHSSTFRHRHSTVIRSNTLTPRDDIESAATQPAAAASPTASPDRSLNRRMRSSKRFNEVFARSHQHAGPVPAPSMRRPLLSMRSTQDPTNGQADTPPGDTGSPFGAVAERERSVSFGRIASSRRPDETADTNATPGTDQNASSSALGSKDTEGSGQEGCNESADIVGELGGASSQLPQRARPLVSSSIRHSDTFKALFFKDPEVGGSFRWDDDCGPSPFHSQQLSEVSSGTYDEGAIEMSTRETIGLWWTVVKASFAYQVLVCIGPLMTGQMVPLANAKQANSQTLGSYYPQVVSFASLLGSLLGSQLIPTFAGSAHEVVPKYPRRTLYGLFAAMLLFVPAFALAIHFGTPAELIPLVFLLFLYGGYVNSLVFGLTNQHMLAEDSRMVQLSMVLTSSLAFFLGSCISWMWSFIKL